MNETIDRFRGKYAFLSSFWRAEIRPFWWPETLPPFPGNEWLFQAWKIHPERITHVDYCGYEWLAGVEKIRSAKTAVEAKRLGSKVVLRPDWNDIRIDVMRYCIQLKFREHADLRVKLLDTGDAYLIEGNNWGDRFWGAEFNSHGGTVGHNWLGQLLMEEREELKNYVNSSR